MRIYSKLIMLCKKILRRILPYSCYDRLRTFYLRYVIGAKTKQPSLKTDAKIMDLPFGINLFIYDTNNSGGVVGRLLQATLNAVEIPYQIIDLGHPERFNAEKENLMLYKINLVVVHAASGTQAKLHLFDIDFSHHYNIAYWAWELKELPDVFCSGYEIFQEVWAISGFCTTALEKKATIPVLTIPHCVNPDNSIIPDGRNYFHLEKDAFLFMFAYDCNSFVSRKNPQAVVKAFLKAFSPEETHVGLILKLLYSESSQEHVDELKKLLSPYKNIYYITQFLSYEEMRTLLQVSDAFVTLHRSEGFGLLPLEAMSLGTPVISTEWSGNMEYMNHKNAALVGCSMVPVNGQYVGSIVGDGLMWADPDIDEAAANMRRMVFDQEWRESLISNGRYTANECFSAKNIGQVVADRLAFLKLKP